MPREDYRLIVFDWDGTLMDSEARILHSMHAAVEEAGMPARDDDAVRGIIGLELCEAVRALFPEADERAVQRVCEGYRRHYFANEVPSPLFPGVREMLERLHGAGYRLAVATGKTRRGLDRALAETGLADLFHATRTADETASKPDPRMLHELTGALGVPATAGLMVGDSAYDILMARAAGMDALAVGWGVLPPERLAALEPAGLVHEVPEIVDWIMRPPAAATQTGSRG